MLVTETHKVKYTNKYFSLLENFSRKTNNLFNQCLWQVKNSLRLYEEAGCPPEDVTKGWLFYTSLNKIAKEMPIHFNNYRKLPAQTAQQCLMDLSEALKSYIKSIKDYSKNPDKYEGKPQFPKYKKKGGKHAVILTNQQIKPRNGKLHFPKMFNGFTLKTNLSNTIREVRILPREGYFKVEIVHEIPDMEMKVNGVTAGIDLGLNNLAAIAFDDFSTPVLVNGKPLKSLNVYHNRAIDKYKSILSKTRGQYTSKRLSQLYLKRNNQIENHLHQASSKIVNCLVERGVSTVIVGHNTGQKTGTKLKNFVQAPIFKLIGLLKYKCAKNGITLIETEEAYTSGTSFIDNELPTKDFYNKNRRTHRGSFVANSGQKINADINSAYQIIKKVEDKLVYTHSTKIFNPIKINL